MIEVSHLSKKYGRLLAVDDVSFTVNDGEILGFLGPNGAGKSTTMNILTGYIPMTEGTVKIDGFDIVNEPKEAKKRIGYLPEIPPLYGDMTVFEYLEFIFELKKVKFPKAPHLEEICRLVGISEVGNRLIKTLSKGYCQRVGFAGALIGNPKVLILDEPTAGLDPKQITEIRALIKRLGKNHTIILSSHILSEIEAVCEHIIIINGGRLIANDTAENLAGGVGEAETLTVRVKTEDDISGILSAIEGARAVERLASREEGTADYKITEDRDIRQAVVEALGDTGIPLLEIRKNEISLEQTFLDLLKESSKSEDAEENTEEDTGEDSEEQKPDGTSESDTNGVSADGENEIEEYGSVEETEKDEESEGNEI